MLLLSIICRLNLLRHLSFLLYFSFLVFDGFYKIWDWPYTQGIREYSVLVWVYARAWDLVPIGGIYYLSTTGREDQYFAGDFRGQVPSSCFWLLQWSYTGVWFFCSRSDLELRGQDSWVQVGVSGIECSSSFSSVSVSLIRRLIQRSHFLSAPQHTFLYS